MLISAQAQPFARQHHAPCSDCPWKRSSIKGWLGPYNVGQWIRLAHSDAQIQCHTRMRQGGDALMQSDHWQCAGAAIYRANVVKFEAHHKEKQL